MFCTAQHSSNPHISNKHLEFNLHTIGILGEILYLVCTPLSITKDYCDLFMRSYNASFVYSRLWLLARETNAFSRELAGFYTTNISHFPPDWAPQEYVGCTARQQQATQPHLKLGWCHQWCSSSLGCTGKAWELLLGGGPGCSPSPYPTRAQPLTGSATWAALEQKKGYSADYWFFTKFSTGLEHFVMLDSMGWNLSQ